MSSTGARCGGSDRGASAAVGAVVVAVLANQSSHRHAPRAGRGRRSGAAVAADPVGRQGKPERDAAAGLRHRYAQQRSRPAVLPRHRPGTGPGFGDRRDRAAKFRDRATQDAAAKPTTDAPAPSPTQAVAPAVAPVTSTVAPATTSVAPTTTSALAKSDPAPKLDPAPKMGRPRTEPKTMEQSPAIASPAPPAPPAASTAPAATPPTPATPLMAAKSHHGPAGSRRPQN